MKVAFDVKINHQPTAEDGSKYQGFVSLDKVVIFTTDVRDPGGPSADRDMKHEVARQFALTIASKL